MNFMATVRAIEILAYRYPKIGPILIEDKANGTAIIQMLRDKLPGIISVRPDASKEARVNAVSFVIEAGDVYLPKDRKWTWEFIDQCAAFPNGKHDDMVDSMSQALAKLIFTRRFRLFEKRRKRGDRYFTLPEEKPSGSEERIMVV
jgi:predicted phage terminase large subunit-like protein